MKPDQRRRDAARYCAVLARRARRAVRSNDREALVAALRELDQRAADHVADSLRPEWLAWAVGEGIDVDRVKALLSE